MVSVSALFYSEWLTIVGCLDVDLSGASSPCRGAQVTGRAILAALTPLGVRATLTDDSPAALQSFAQDGVAVIDPANAVETIGDYDLVVTSPGFRADCAPVLDGCGRRGGAHLG